MTGGAALVDHHVHLDALTAGSRREWLEASQRQGTVAALIPGCFPEQWPEVLGLCSKREGEGQGAPLLVGALGLHPYWTDSVKLSPDALCSALEAKLGDERIVALGECGLDKGRGALVERQSACFEAQLRLARERELPVVCHQVGRRDEFLSGLERTGGCPQGGVVHGFSGDAAWAKALVRRGFFLGVGAGILHSARKRLRQAVVEVPWAHLLVETDEIAHEEPPTAVNRLQRTLEELAKLKQTSPMEAAAQTAKNARRLYRLP